MPSLILIKAPGNHAAMQTYPLTRGQIAIIGRDAEHCQVVIPNSSVSRKHAIVSWVDEQCQIEDCGSRNGTLINQQRITEKTILRNEDRVRICDFVFKFHDENALPAPDFEPDLAEESDDDDTGMTRVDSFDPKRSKSYLDAQPSEKIRALLEISTGLSKTLELDPLLEQIATTTFSVFLQADRCFIILLDAANRLIPKVEKSRRGRPGDEGTRFSRTIVRNTLKSAQAYLSFDAASDTEMGMAQSVAEFRIRSVMCVPMINSSGVAIGAIQLDTQDTSKKFTGEDLKLLSIVANLASVAVEKAQVHAQLLSREKERKEIEVARNVQKGFLPKVYPNVAGYEFFAFYSAAQSVGGDYYDFIQCPNGRIGICLADVAGKGVAAALLMAKLSAETRYCMLTKPDPAEAIRMLNNQLINGGIGDKYVTFVLLLLDPVAHQLTIVNAGHLHPLCLKTTEHKLIEITNNDSGGFALGFVPDAEYIAQTIPLELGETVMVFTDGVLDAEAPDDRRYNMEGLQASLEQLKDSADRTRPSRVGEHVVHSVQNHLNGRSQFDDIAFVSFGRVDSVHDTKSQVVPKIETEPRHQP